MKKLITVTDARKQMLTGNAFDMVYCTYDERRSTGGERVSVRKCLLFANDEEKKEMSQLPVLVAGEKIMKSKNPNHEAHNTFNIRLQNTEVKKVHWLLIEEFNNQKVVM